MKHRDRVLIALNHEEPDRCPLQISFTPEFVTRLKHDLDIDDEEMHNPHGGGNTYVIERKLGQDMLLTSVGWANSYYASETYGEDGRSYVDEWGVVWKSVGYETRFGPGQYTEIVGHPLDSDDAIDSYIAPDPHRPELYEEAARVIREFKDEYWIVGVTVTTVFETAWALQGYEKTLADFVLNLDLIDRLLEIPFTYHLEAAKKLTDMGVDMIWIGDDVGAQDRMIISPKTWRRFLKPRMETFISALKRINPSLLIAYHSDGNISPIIPDLIEIGLDVLNPIQPKSMDPSQIKKLYGDHLSFWGSIDEQYTLPFGSPEDVKQEVVTRLKTIGDGGGLIIGPTHNVQLDTPLDNFWAMINTVLETPYDSI